MGRFRLYGAINLIVIGITLLLCNFLSLEVHAWSVAFAEMLIIASIFLLLPKDKSRQKEGFRFHQQDLDEVLLFTSSSFTASATSNRYIVLFSSTTIQLPKDMQDAMEIQAVFSQVHVVLPEERKINVRLSGAFSQATMKGRSIEGFGTHEAIYGHGAPGLLNANAVFSSMTIV